MDSANAGVPSSHGRLAHLDRGMMTVHREMSAPVRSDAAPVAAASASVSSPDFVLLTAEPLEQSKYSVSTLVGCPSAGALSSFLGVTRDSFQGKRVLRLEYEAYDAMAIKQMHGLCAGIRSRWPNVTRCAILHRTGVVGVGEASVLIAVSSPHRRESLEAVAWCIDELKRVLCVSPHADNTVAEQQKHTAISRLLCVVLSSLGMEERAIRGRKLLETERGVECADTHGKRSGRQRCSNHSDRRNLQVSRSKSTPLCFSIMSCVLLKARIQRHLTLASAHPHLAPLAVTIIV